MTYNKECWYDTKEYFENKDAVWAKKHLEKIQIVASLTWGEIQKCGKL